MNNYPSNASAIEQSAVGFWETLAPQLSKIEDHYLNRSSIRRMAPAIQGPVLVVGAGQGLIVAELRKLGLHCDGVDYSAEMLRYAKTRRGLNLIHADAATLPFAAASYQTVIYATGVIDMTNEDDAVRAILAEGRRVLNKSGTIYVAFYRLSDALEILLKQTGLLKSHTLANRESLESYLLSPLQTVAWVAKKAGVSRLRAIRFLLRSWLLSTFHDKSVIFNMQRVFRSLEDPHSLTRQAAEYQVYRDAAEIRNLFQRLAIPINQVRQFTSCTMVKL
jgi:SAM-dependent methyltransferase